MNKDLIAILSNLDSRIIFRDEAKKTELEKIKKEKEAAEEEENERIYGYRWPNQWMRDHKQDYLDGKYHGYKYGVSTTYSSNDYCTINFYEWSTMENRPKKFYSYNNFNAFCKDCNIILTEFDKSRMKAYSCMYITCTPGHRTLLISATEVGLQSLINEANNSNHKV